MKHQKNIRFEAAECLFLRSLTPSRHRESEPSKKFQQRENDVTQIQGKGTPGVPRFCKVIGAVEHDWRNTGYAVVR
jgi:hypothetical protein